MGDYRPKPNTPLTWIEQRVLELVSRGYTNNEVAVAINRSPDTARTHTIRTYRRLRARNRAHAVRLGFELGYLALDLPTDRTDDHDDGDATSDDIGRRREPAVDDRAAYSRDPGVPVAD